VHGKTTLYANFTAAEHANFLGAKTVAHATALLDGRNDGAQALRNARAITCELIAAPDDPAANAILDPARLLVVAMMGAASADPGSPRQDRWMHVMGALVELVRHEANELKQSGGYQP
jgi:hypothetical protein